MATAKPRQGVREGYTGLRSALLNAFGVTGAADPARATHAGTAYEMTKGMGNYLPPWLAGAFTDAAGIANEGIAGVLDTTLNNPNINPLDPTTFFGSKPFFSPTGFDWADIAANWEGIDRAVGEMNNPGANITRTPRGSSGDIAMGAVMNQHGGGSSGMWDTSMYGPKPSGGPAALPAGTGGFTGLLPQGIPNLNVSPQASAAFNTLLPTPTEVRGNSPGTTVVGDDPNLLAEQERRNAASQQGMQDFMQFRDVLDRLFGLKGGGGMAGSTWDMPWDF